MTMNRSIACLYMIYGNDEEFVLSIFMNEY